MADDTKQDLIKKLRKRKASLADLMEETEVVDDVLHRKVLKRKSKGVFSKAFTEGGATFTTEQHPQAEKIQRNISGDLHYVPQGKMEKSDEYQRRIQLTPFFPKLPSILCDRQGALFSNPPVLDGPDAEQYADFEAQATRDGKSLLQAIAKVAELLQRRAKCAIFVDPDPLPADVQDKVDKGGTVSVKEQQDRKLGVPHLAIYQLPQILDYEEDADGLMWIKLVEADEARASFDQGAGEVQIFRVIDRETTRSWRVERKKDANGHVEETVAELAPVPHHDKIKGRCPVVLLPQLEDDEDSGLWMSLSDVAHADVCATRVLSDITWSLYVLGNPILLFHHNRDPKKLPDFAAEAGRYWALENEKGNRAREEMAFLQLDTAGLELQIDMYGQFCEKAMELAGKGTGNSAVAAPVEQSGISRAWQFKTGEERVLFMLTRQLQAGFDRVLDLVALISGRDPDAVTIKFCEKFDMGDRRETLEVGSKILSLANQYNLPTALHATLKNMLGLMANLSDAEWKAMDEEIKKAKPVEPVEIMPNGKPGNGRKEEDDRDDD